MSTSKESLVARKLNRRAFGRYLFILAFAAFILTPACVQFLYGDVNATAENRELASMPAIPKNRADLFKFSEAIDNYLKDHFGLRERMVEWNNQLRYHVLGDINAVQLTRGKDGYIFFNSHVASDPRSMVNFLCGKNISTENRAEIAHTVTTMMRAAIAQQANSVLLVVPTKPVIYTEKMPAWMQAQCHYYTATVPSVMGLFANEPDLRNKIAYPLDEMLALKYSKPVFPKENFHWDGDGPEPIAALIASQYFHQPKQVTLKTFADQKPSDLQRFLPGIPLNVAIHSPYYAKAGIQECEGGTCFPELGTAALTLGDVSRYTSKSHKGPKLLIISDSFGHGIAGYFSEYYGEVWHISINSLKQLTPEELKQAREVAFEKFKPDQVLYVFHDFAIAYFDIQVLPFIKGEFGDYRK